ncbi:MAG: hypothetical protein KJZ86_15295 [Caldilineaceae bacterium]|nr:hypothetical protein [Caldilineaceae bacterium]HRJ45515.1 hypothetical protein [Caldilineaceae bacterium]
MKVGNSNGNDSHWQWSAVLTERIPHGWLEKAGWMVAPASETLEPAEVLDVHSRQLLSGGTASGEFVLRIAVNGDEIAALTHLAEQVAGTVRPAHPRALFRKELRAALLTTHRQQAAQRRLFAHPLFEKGVVDRSLLERLDIKSLWFWQIAAAVPVLIAVAALLWRYAHRTAEGTGKLTVEA